jgi:hypothetical protein
MADEITDTIDIVNKVNEALDGLLFEDKPCVCFCCDSLLMGEHEQTWFTINSLHEIKSHFIVENLSPELLNDYKYVDEDNPNWISTIMIPKQSVYDSKSKSFLTCNNCYSRLGNEFYPTYGICNGFSCGSAPKELEELTEIELSFISPSHIHGNMFTYFGGPKSIQSWHSLVQCDLKSIYHTLHGMKKLNVPNRIAIVISGSMTQTQRDNI